MVDKFRALGVEVIDSPEQAEPGQTVIIRSHGVARQVYEQLEQRDVEIIDATCPFVKRIHGLVSQAEKEGALPIIIGTPSHPEVEGIAGWCSHCRVFENLEALKNWASTQDNPCNSSICMVSQTTLTESLWKSCVDFAKKQFTNLKFFDTICRATEYRQSEAASLSEVCQAMVVVGDPSSSNTGRLAMICREHCGKVFLVDNASELVPEDFRSVSDVG
ncbi:LytB protein, partial [gut metagenome]